MGANVTEFKQPWGKACFAPVCDYRRQGDRRLVHVAAPSMAQQHELLGQLVSRKPKGSRKADPAHSDMGWQYQQAGWCRRLGRGRRGAEHVPEASCIDNGATQTGVRPHQGRVLPRKDVADFESPDMDLDDFVWSIGTRGGARLN